MSCMKTFQSDCKWFIVAVVLQSKWNIYKSQKGHIETISRIYLRFVLFRRIDCVSHSLLLLSGKSCGVKQMEKPIEKFADDWMKIIWMWIFQNMPRLCSFAFSFFFFVFFGVEFVLKAIEWIFLLNDLSFSHFAARFYDFWCCKALLEYANLEQQMLCALQRERQNMVLFR